MNRFQIYLISCLAAPVTFGFVDLVVDAVDLNWVHYLLLSAPLLGSLFTFGMLYIYEKTQ